MILTTLCTFLHVYHHLLSDIDPKHRFSSKSMIGMCFVLVLDLCLPRWCLAAISIPYLVVALFGASICSLNAAHLASI